MGEIWGVDLDRYKNRDDFVSHGNLPMIYLWKYIKGKEYIEINRKIMKLNVIA